MGIHRVMQAISDGFRGGEGVGRTVTVPIRGGAVWGHLTGRGGSRGVRIVSPPDRISRGPISSPARGSGISPTSSRRGHGERFVGASRLGGASVVSLPSGVCSSGARGLIVIPSHI